MKKYRYKLNMLEPGLKIMKVIGLFGVLGFVFHIVKAVLLCYIFVGLAVVLGIILWVLIMIEQHQDNVLNKQALNEENLLDKRTK